MIDYVTVHSDEKLHWKKPHWAEIVLQKEKKKEVYETEYTYIYIYTQYSN